MFSIRTLVVLVLVGLSGCGPVGPAKVDVTGRVTLAGEPVDGGHIRFIPVAPTQGPVTGSHIVKGQYAATGAGAVPVGQHRVEITWIREVPVSTGADDAATPVLERIPPRYNVGSELKLEVPNQGAITRDFDLMP